MVQRVLMPKLGQTMEEGTVEKWVKKEGDTVGKGDVLLEITTDKATLEVESYVEGTLRKIVAQEGEVVPVAETIAVVADPDEEIPDDFLKPAAPKPTAAAPTEEAPEPAAQAETSAAAAPPPPTHKLFASPRARRRAQDEKISLKVLTGSGPNGRIVEKDLLDYLEKLKGLRVSPVAKEIAFQRDVDLLSVTGTGPGGKIMKEDVEAAPAAAAPTAKPQALSAMRRVVADRMSLSKREIPHFYLMMDIDMTEAVKFRAGLNAEGNVKISFNDLIMKACAKGMAAAPGMLAGWENDAIMPKTEVNVGIAVALDDGLIVPVVKNIDRKPLSTIASEAKGLIERARSKRLTPDEYQGGCLTISNLGMYDIDLFIPIINPGESAILGVGRIAEQVVARDGGIHVRSMMTMTLSGDHRVIDGAVAASFLKTVKDALESPQDLAK